MKRDVMKRPAPLSPLPPDCVTGVIGSPLPGRRVVLAVGSPLPARSAVITDGSPLPARPAVITIGSPLPPDQRGRPATRTGGANRGAAR